MHRNFYSDLIQHLKDYENQPADYWYWLARPDVGTEDACLLIANIQPGSLSEQNLKSRQKNLLMVARTLVSESGIEKLPALEWLRWAVEHEELLIGYGAEKEQLQIILRAVDRNSGQQQKAELEILRQQLEQERAAREAAEVEVAQLRERLVSADPQARELRTPATGLTFPYSTKMLEAMRATVAKYWESYTPDKRQPTQKEIQQELCRLLGIALDPYKQPSQKAIYLATAIKPDDLPSA